MLNTANLGWTTPHTQLPETESSAAPAADASAVDLEPLRAHQRLEQA